MPQNRGYTSAEIHELEKRARRDIPEQWGLWVKGEIDFYNNTDIEYEDTKISGKMDQSHSYSLQKFLFAQTDLILDWFDVNNVMVMMKNNISKL